MQGDLDSLLYHPGSKFVVGNVRLLWELSDAYTPDSMKELPGCGNTFLGLEIIESNNCPNDKAFVVSPEGEILAIIDLT